MTRQAKTGRMPVALARQARRGIADLEYMREQEKLARDVYRTLYGFWGLAVFFNIAASEQVHTTQVEDTPEKYGLPAPVWMTRPGCS